MMKKLLLTVIIGLVAGCVFGTTVHAETGVRYDTFTISDGEFVPTQTAYISLTSEGQIHGEPLNVPNDIHIDEDNHVYVASTDDVGETGKIIKFSLETNEVTVFGEDYLIDPTGVFVDEFGQIFVADRGGNKAYKLDASGQILQIYTKPDSPLFAANEFQPQKILTDNRENVYILNNGSNGLAQFTDDGAFLGYFGTNSIQPSLRTVLQFMFFSDEQRAQLYRLSPPEISNMAIDDRGLIHTVSLGVEGTGVKRLNISGENLLGEVHHLEDLQDVYVGPIGNIFTVSKSGFIYEYDIEGNLLFAFGGQDESNQVQGLFNVPSAIAVDSHSNIYVLDSSSRQLQIFIPTEFATLVHKALALYQNGDYVESSGPWKEVLKMNDMFDLAHKGLGNAYYSIGEYEDALDEYEISRDAQGYSDAFWEVRNAYLIDSMGVILLIVFIFLVAYVINMKAHYFKYVRRPIAKGIRLLRNRSKTLDECLYMFSYLKNPADATYMIKRQNRVGYFPASLLLIIYFLFYVYYLYNTKFLFNDRVIADINLLEEILKVFLPFVLFVFANYLIGTIREGEGRFKDIYITTVFAITPLFISYPIIAWLSHGLTYNEAFIIQAIRFLGVAVTVIYFFFMVKETHFYTVKETIMTTLITFFTMVMLLLGTIIVYMLLNELGKLVFDLIREVYYRV